MPWLYGILSIFFLSIASAAIVCVLDIKGKLNCFLIRAVMPVFPSITATFFFMYTVVQDHVNGTFEFAAMSIYEANSERGAVKDIL